MTDIQDTPDEWECPSCLDLVIKNDHCPGCTTRTNVNREGPPRTIKYDEWIMCPECHCEGGDEERIEGEDWETISDETEWVHCTTCNGVGAIKKENNS